MKTLDKISILCIGLLLLGCTGSKERIPDGPGEVPPKDQPKPAPETHTLTFVLPEDGFKTSWENGDAIVVHGEYAQDQVTVTLSTGDISQDGKTATKEVSGLIPYVNGECTSTLYASWPAEATDNKPHCFWYTGFNSTNTPMLAACNDADYKFSFKNLSCSLTFTVDGDYDGFDISGRKDAVIGAGHFQVLITDQEENLDQYREEDRVTISGTLKKGAAAVQGIYLPGSVDFPKGYIIRMYKGGKAVKAYTHKAAVSVERGAKVEIGDITNLLEDVELDIDLENAKDLSDGKSKIANCYIVTAAGHYKIPTVRGNSSTALEGMDNAVVLWETWNNGEEVTRKSVIQSVHYSGNYLYFRTPDTFHSGNAVIAVRDEEDNVIWGWHIWLPKSMPTDITDANVAAQPVMSRNLGALEDVPAEGLATTETYGLFYQWGRKDPFPCTNIKVAGTQTSKVKGQVSINEAMTTPCVYYYNNDGGKETFWHNEGEVVSSKLWQQATSSKTWADPCPYGYRMPARPKSSGTFFDSALTLSGAAFFSLDQENCKYKVGTVWFPITGYIGRDEEGAAAYVGAGVNAMVWTGHYDSGTTNGYCMFGTAGDEFKTRGIAQAWAGSVRCVAVAQ